MKKLRYVLVFIFAIGLASCTDENIGPLNDEDDPIHTPPPPPPPNPPK